MTARTIEQLSNAIDSLPGPYADLEVDQKCRMEYLLVQNTSMIRQTLFADTKAGALLAAVGVLGLQGPSFTEMGVQAGIISFAFIGLCGLALCACIASIFPRYPNRGARKTILDNESWSWPALGSEAITAEQYADRIEGQSLSHLYRSLAHSNAQMAKIILRKYQMQRFAFSCATLAFLIWAIPTVISLDLVPTAG